MNVTRTVIDCAQGSPEWIVARLGIPTASRFADIVTPLGKPRKGEKPAAYMAALLAERYTGAQTGNFATAAMQRGTELEPQARAAYEFERNMSVARPGFVRCECQGIAFGCSPDGVLADRGLEIKCPLPQTLVGMLLDDAPPEEYLAQCHAGMLCTGLPRWDLLVWAPPTSGLPSRVWTIAADADLQAAMLAAVVAFALDLEVADAKLAALGGRKVRPMEECRDTMAEGEGNASGEGREV